VAGQGAPGYDKGLEGIRVSVSPNAAEAAASVATIAAAALLQTGTPLAHAADGDGRPRSPPIENHASEAAVLQLRTGITAFPWVAVVEERSTEIDLGEWDAASASALARELAAGALGGNHNVRSVRVNGVELALSHGWATPEFPWRNIRSEHFQALFALPATVSLVLQNCTCLSKLDAR
jgi:hypothetical protein